MKAVFPTQVLTSRCASNLFHTCFIGVSNQFEARAGERPLGQFVQPPRHTLGSLVAAVVVVVVVVVVLVVAAAVVMVVVVVVVVVVGVCCCCWGGCCGCGCGCSCGCGCRVGVNASTCL